MNKKLATAVVAIGLSSPTLAFGDYVYTYTGNPYDTAAGVGFSAGNQITVSLDTPVQLAPNSSYTLTQFTHWSISDGLNVCNDQSSCTMTGFGLDTDKDGFSSVWEVNANTTNPGTGRSLQLESSSSPFVVQFGSTVYTVYDATVCNACAALAGSSTRGVWSVAPVPLPAAFWLLLSGLGGMAALMRRAGRASAH